MAGEDTVAFAYSYPFSKEAKGVITSKGNEIGVSSEPFLRQAKARLEEAFNGKKAEFKKIKYGQMDYVIGYAYARMLVSAMGNKLAISRYIDIETQRSKDAIENDTEKNVLKLASELGLHLDLQDGQFAIGLSDFLMCTADDKNIALTNFRLHNGIILLSRHDLAIVLGGAIRKEIEKGLPIKASELPKEVLSFSKTIPPPKASLSKASSVKGQLWIERLLETPIPDVRHRTVNLILAPYLVNVKGLDEADASKIISEYIEKCKIIDPNTKITDSYIRYQCGYAKKRGLKPLSFKRAKELLGDFLEEPPKTNS